MPDMEAIGWVPTWRRIQFSPVWRKPKALQLFIWLFLNAAHEARIDNSSGHPVPLERGQVYASLAQAVEACPLSVKEVRNAFAWLETEGMISRDSVSSVIAITKYEEYQVGTKEETSFLGQGKGHRNGQGESAKKGKAGTDENDLRDSGKADCECDEGARRKRKEGQGKGHSNGQGGGEKTRAALSSPSTRARAGETVVKEDQRSLKKTTKPPTPFCKGGRDFPDSSALLGTDGERVEMVLGVWREERAAAGLSALPGRRSLRAAKLLAGYLANAAMSVNTLRGGIKKLIHDIVGDPDCKRYDLLTLANNPEKYCPAPVIARKKRRWATWRWTCNVCGRDAVSARVDASKVMTGYPCDDGSWVTSGCQGVMEPIKESEGED